MSKVAIINHPIKCPWYHEATCFADIPPKECNKRVGGPAYQITFPDNCPLKDAPLNTVEKPQNSSASPVQQLKSAMALLSEWQAMCGDDSVPSIQRLNERTDALHSATADI